MFRAFDTSLLKLFLCFDVEDKVVGDLAIILLTVNYDKLKIMHLHMKLMFIIDTLDELPQKKL